MSAANASSSSSQLVSYAQDVDYTCTEGFKQFKAQYNIKNAWATHNNPNAAYPSAETVYQAVKGLGCTLHSLDSLSSSQASVLGALLCSSNETMHAEVGQVQQPGAKLGDDQHLLSTSWYRWDWSLPFDGGCSINGWLNCRSIVGIN